MIAVIPVNVYFVIRRRARGEGKPRAGGPCHTHLRSGLRSCVMPHRSFRPINVMISSMVPFDFRGENIESKIPDRTLQTAVWYYLYYLRRYNHLRM